MGGTYISKLEHAHFAQLTNRLPPYFRCNVQLYERHLRRTEQGVLATHDGGLSVSCRAKDGDTKLRLDDLTVGKGGERKG